MVFGGYRARKIGAGTDQNITTEALIIDRPRANFLSVYNTGCCEDPISLTPTSVSGFVGAGAHLEIKALNCQGEEIDYTGNSQKTSSNIAVATVDLTGLVSLVLQSFDQPAKPAGLLNDLRGNDRGLLGYRRAMWKVHGFERPIHRDAHCMCSSVQARRHMHDGWPNHC